MLYDKKYTELLVEAQEKHKAYKREADSYKYYFDVDPLRVPFDIQRKLETAEGAWYSWIKKNITDKGFCLDFDTLGRPTGLLKIVALQPAYYDV